MKCFQRKNPPTRRAARISSGGQRHRRVVQYLRKRVSCATISVTHSGTSTGRLAQRERRCLTSTRSQVQILYRPPLNPQVRRFSSDLFFFQGDQGEQAPGKPAFHPIRPKRPPAQPTAFKLCGLHLAARKTPIGCAAAPQGGCAAPYSPCAPFTAPSISRAWASDASVASPESIRAISAGRSSADSCRRQVWGIPSSPAILVTA